MNNDKKCTSINLQVAFFLCSFCNNMHSMIYSIKCIDIDIHCSSFSPSLSLFMCGKTRTVGIEVTLHYASLDTGTQPHSLSLSPFHPRSEKSTRTLFDRPHTPTASHRTIPHNVESRRQHSTHKKMQTVK